MKMELIIRFDYGSIVPWVKRIEGGLSAVAGPDHLQLITPVALNNHDFVTDADFMVGAGRARVFHLDLAPVSRRSSAARRSLVGHSGNGSLVARVVLALHVPRQMA